MRRLSHSPMTLERLKETAEAQWVKIQEVCHLKGGGALPKADFDLYWLEGGAGDIKGKASWPARLVDGVLTPNFLGEGPYTIQIGVKRPEGWSERPTFECGRDAYQLSNFLTHEIMHGMGLGQVGCLSDPSSFEPRGCPRPECTPTLWETKIRAEGAPLTCYTGGEAFLGGVLLSQSAETGGHLTHPAGGAGQLSYGVNTHSCLLFGEDDVKMLEAMGYECSGVADPLLPWMFAVGGLALICLVCLCARLRRRCISRP